MHSQRDVTIKTYKRKPPQENPVAVSWDLLFLSCKTCNGYLGLVIFCLDEEGAYAHAARGGDGGHEGRQGGHYDFHDDF